MPTQTFLFISETFFSLMDDRKKKIPDALRIIKWTTMASYIWFSKNLKIAF